MNRERLQQLRDIRISNLRAKANELRSKAESIRVSLPDDYSYWTQPVSIAGRRRNQARLNRSSELYSQAIELEKKANELAAKPVRVKGDAETERRQKIDACDVQVGQTVRSVYGDRVVEKVNKKTVLLAGDLGPIRIEKHLLMGVVS